MANCFYVMARMHHLYKFTISHHCNGAWKMSRFAPHMPEAATDWLNSLSLGTMSASAYIENLAQNSACLINYQEITRSIKIFLV